MLILGAGGWGTALALVLNEAGHRVSLWGHDPQYTRFMAAARGNPKYLPKAEIPGEIEIITSLDPAPEGLEAIFSAIPSQYLRSALQPLRAQLPGSVAIISCSKGIERGTLLFPSEILRQELQASRVAVLSGPSHAEEVARRLPTALVAASSPLEDAGFAQRLFAATRVRVYTSTDHRGVELGGAVKNIIAIAAGISDGLGFGDNSRSALITRGAAEITRLGLALGARRETFSGLSGIGDLITTCTSEHSRNRRVGFRLGRGEKLPDILSSTPMIAEGVETTRSVQQLARRLGVEMPITQEVHSVLYEGKPPEQAVEALLARSTKEEEIIR
ncbi:MAG: NAD(P)-dependent glycerol-3-phosphate dehydrogenase [Planctomycetes bacterium]|nr:NAD(P)-dependent glycerol-3-phosphate dehydrogenase [Planctomycetota bacterium]